MLLTFYLTVGVLLSVTGGTVSESTLSIPIETMKAMTLDEQKNVIKAQLEHRLSLLQNIEFHSTTTTTRHLFVDGSVGDEIDSKWGTQESLHIKWLNGAYWLSAKLLARERLETPDIVSISNYDSSQGVSRAIMLENGGKEELSARIDLKMDDTIELCRAAQCLLDLPDMNNRRIIGAMIMEQDSWNLQFKPESQLLVIQYPYRDETLTPEYKLRGSCEVELDCQRGMVPIRQHLSYELNIDGDRIWRDETVFMRDVNLIDGLWIPHEYETIVRTEQRAGELPNECVVSRTTLRDVTLGAVKREDLDVEFPEGTFVTDIVSGTSYVIGSNGKPTKEKPLVTPEVLAANALNPENLQSDSGWFTQRNMLIFINLIVVAILIVVLYFRRRQRQAG